MFWQYLAVVEHELHMERFSLLCFLPAHGRQLHWDPTNHDIYLFYCEHKGYWCTLKRSTVAWILTHAQWSIILDWGKFWGWSGSDCRGKITALMEWSWTSENLIGKHDNVLWRIMRKWNTDTTSFQVYRSCWCNFLQTVCHLKNEPQSRSQKYGKLIFFPCFCSVCKSVLKIRWSTDWRFSPFSDWVSCNCDLEPKDHRHNAVLLFFASLYKEWAAIGVCELW